jgi:hypothetical protein
MFSTKRQIAVLSAAAFISVLALAACGGNDSDTGRTRNAISPTATCAEGGECIVGDIGPGGGLVFYDAGQNEEWGRYLEVAPPGWAGAEKWPIDPKARLCSEVESCPEFKQSKRTIGLGKSTWAEVSERECEGCAQNLLKNLNEGEIKDWFLPNIRELRALLNSGTKRTLDGDSYFSISNSREVSTSYLVWRSEWNGTANIRAAGSKLRRIVPIRQFAAMQQAVADTNQAESEQSNVLETVSNLRVRFENGKMIFDFDKQNKGLAPEGHFIRMYWEALNGSNDIMVNGDSTSGSTNIYSFMRGTKVTAYVSSYTNATSPPSIADTDKIDITIPMTDDTPASTSEAETPTDQTVSEEIGNVNEPILNVPSGGTEGEINPGAIIDNLATQIPQVEVEKIELMVRTPLSEPGDAWQPVSTKAPTPYSIPADATSVTLRITSTDGNVIEQEKLIVKVAATGEASLPEVAPVVATSSTTVPTSETTAKKPATTKTTTPSADKNDDVATDSTVAPEEDSVDTTVPESTTDTTSVDASDSSDDGSSGTNPIVWVLIAIIALLLAGFAAQQMKKKKD